MPCRSPGETSSSTGWSALVSVATGSAGCVDSGASWTRGTGDIDDELLPVEIGFGDVDLCGSLGTPSAPTAVSSTSVCNLWVHGTEVAVTDALVGRV